MSNKPYRHQEYPKMAYDPDTAEYGVFNNAEEVPEGWVTSLDDVKNLQQGVEPSPAPLAKIMAAPTSADTEDDDETPTSKKAPAKKAAATKKAPAKKAAATKKAPAKKAAKSPLEELNLSREEAIEILEEEKVEFDDSAEDDVIAELVKDVLE